MHGTFLPKGFQRGLAINPIDPAADHIEEGRGKIQVEAFSGLILEIIWGSRDENVGRLCVLAFLLCEVLYGRTRLPTATK